MRQGRWRLFPSLRTEFENNCQNLSFTFLTSSCFMLLFCCYNLVLLDGEIDHNVFLINTLLTIIEVALNFYLPYFFFLLYVIYVVYVVVIVFFLHVSLIVCLTY